MPRKTLDGAAQTGRAVPASMRPRPDAAENGPCSAELNAAHVHASMRPRPDAAENAAGMPPRRDPDPSFNEAAARCRGKLPGQIGQTGRSGRFNEAAARCRGKLAAATPATWLQVGLQ